MNNKIDAVIEKQACPVCGVTHETGWMYDSKMVPDVGGEVVTGFALCSDHQKLTDRGFLHLVVASFPQKKSYVELDEAYRLGKSVSISRELAAQIFGPRIPNDVPLVFIDLEAAEKIQHLLTKLKLESNNEQVNLGATSLDGSNDGEVGA
jgi:hypothetical protein